MHHGRACLFPLSEPAKRAFLVWMSVSFLYTTSSITSSVPCPNPTPNTISEKNSQHGRSDYNYSICRPNIVKAPKTQPNPQKAASILAWFHKTAQAHSIKDLEKTLPQVSSVNGMQVKDYLQALSDDNKIRVEKIGSGNWYWSFPADEKKAKNATLKKAQEEYDKVRATVSDLQAKVEGAEAARAEDEDMLMEPGQCKRVCRAPFTERLQAAIAELSSQSTPAS